MINYLALQIVFAKLICIYIYQIFKCRSYLLFWTNNAFK